jgi:hypothetical protein
VTQQGYAAAGLIDLPLGRHPYDPTRFAVVTDGSGEARPDAHVPAHAAMYVHTGDAGCGRVTDRVPQPGESGGGPRRRRGRGGRGGGGRGLAETGSRYCRCVGAVAA